MIRRTILAACLALAMLPVSERAAGQEVEAPSVEEVIGHFSTGTGFTKDALELFFETDQDGFGQAQQYLLALDVLNKLYNAQDSEAFAALFDAAWDHAQGKILEKILTQSAQGLVAAIKLYWDALQLTRDYVVVPALDERVYEAYAQLRGVGGGVNLPAEAFDQLAYGTFGNWSGVTYFALREKMLDQLIDAKGYNRSVMSDKQVEALKKQLDDFWTKRLESRYQREVFRRDWPKIRAALEAEGAAIEARLRRGSPEILTAILPVFPRDLPGHAWLRQDGDAVGAWETRCERGCSNAVDMYDKPPPHDFTDPKTAPLGATFHQVNCHFEALYTGDPIPSIHKDQVSVGPREGLSAMILKDSSEPFPYETLGVFYRGYHLEAGCNSQRQTVVEEQNTAYLHVAKERTLRQDGTPALSHEATTFYIRKLLDRVDALYQDGTIR